ncbi:MAG TPA: adenosylcobinamide-GDP ribazoletransferase [Actinomycetota bacterium]|nr:adenosylcobinamide-GDP ribazoletransferase [Actinomycetota bacterium]
MNGFLSALTFLTRVPAGARAGDAGSLARGVPWFPVVGVLVGGASGAVFYFTELFLTPFVAAGLAVVTGVLLTGAFHEDGLADTVDAFGGSHTREDALRIFKDPTHGTFGVLALVATFALRAGALASLSGVAAIAAMCASHALARSSAVSLFAWIEPVREGLGATYASSVSKARVAITVAIGIVVCVAALGTATIAAVVGCALVTLFFGRLTRARIGGLNGDVLGAVEQVCEAVILLVAVAL